MHSGGWIALLHQIPKSQHGNLVFTTIAGFEIASQAILRIDAGYILVRGRQTGVPDGGGGFFFIPYDHILFLGFQKKVQETVIRAIYGDGIGTAPASEEGGDATPDDAPISAPEETAAEPPPTLVAATAPTPEPAKPAIANKAALLERLRARRNDPTSDAAQA